MRELAPYIVRWEAIIVRRFPLIVDADHRVFTTAGIYGGMRAAFEESLVDDPATMSASNLTDVERDAAGISESLVRIPFGVEYAEHLIADLNQALAKL